MFDNRVRVGALTSNGDGVKKRTVEGYLRGVAQFNSDVGDKDPYLDVLGNIDFRLSWKLHAYDRAYSPHTKSSQYQLHSCTSVGITSTMGMHTNSPYNTFSTLVSYSSSDPDNIAREENTRVRPPSGWWTFNFSSTPVVFNPPTHLCPSFDRPPSWPSP